MPQGRLYRTEHGEESMCGQHTLKRAQRTEPLFPTKTRYPKITACAEVAAHLEREDAHEVVVLAGVRQREVHGHEKGGAGVHDGGQVLRDVLHRAGRAAELHRGELEGGLLRGHLLAVAQVVRASHFEPARMTEGVDACSGRGVRVDIDKGWEVGSRVFMAVPGP